MKDNIEDWESGKLGLSAEHTVKAEAVPDAEIDEAAGVKPISVRLDVELVEDFKALARVFGVSYQPLMRRALSEYAEYKKASMKSHIGE